MAAQENLSQQLFHGTGADLSVGDVIGPRGDVAWAATSPGLAHYHAAANLHTPKHLTYDEEGNLAPKRHWQMPMFTPVYTVEPVDSEEMKKTSEEKGAPSDTRVSNKGFRVTGLHKLVALGKER
jgi:hypothetical protein